MIQEPILTTSLSIASDTVKEYREKLIQTSTNIAKQVIHQKKDEKQEQLASNMCGVLLRLDEGKFKFFVDCWTNNKLFNHTKFKNNGYLPGLWPDEIKELAKQVINMTPTTIGTPNAASGKGELFLRLSSRQFKAPTKGDVEYDNGKTKTIYELKKGGKIGSKIPYKLVNEKLIIFCKTHGLNLPEAKRGTSAKGNQQFIPGTPGATAFLGSLTKKLEKAFWKEFWNELKFSSPFPALKEYSWKNVQFEIVKASVRDHFKETRCSILVIHDNYNYNIFHNPNNFIKYYKGKEIDFEIRAYQNNPLTFYVC